MNLKEAFRFQNKLQSLMDEAESILMTEDNIVTVENTYLHKKVMPELENEVIPVVPDCEYADRITEMVDFALYLFGEQEKLSEAIYAAKAGLPVHLDSEISLNGRRQSLARVFSTMTDLRSSEVLLPGGGTGYRFNAEGNQVAYRVDVRRVRTINYDRNKVRQYMNQLNKASDATSAALDRCMVESSVSYEAPFDVNDTFAQVFEAFLEARSVK
ncbi:MAG: hypothetical protein IJM90_09075 [Firmicutes bacterium]|nr:hypothetical protein [Bacillota bacterium]